MYMSSSPSTADYKYIQNVGFFLNKKKLTFVCNIKRKKEKETAFFKCPGSEMNRMSDLFLNIIFPDSDELLSINKIWLVALHVLC